MTRILHSKPKKRISAGYVRISGPNRRRKSRVSISKSDIPAIINDIKRGYAIGEFDFLKEALGVNREKLAKITGIPLVTIFRRKSLGRFTPDESEKMYRLRKLYETALEVLEKEDNVKSWFNTPQIVFEGKTPLEYADTLPGSEEVERVLRRMEHGIIL